MHDMIHSKNVKLIPIVAIICLLLVFAYGVGDLKTYPIENDEVRTLNHIEPVWLTHTLTIPETVRSVATLSKQHGPAYFLMLNAWYKLAGEDLFSLRLLSTLFCVLSLAMAHRLALISGKRGDAVVVMLTVSFLAFYLYFAQYLRMYTLLSFATGWVLWAYWSALRVDSPRFLIWVSLFVAAAIVPYTHYLGSLIVAAIGVYHVVFAKRNKRWWQVLAVFSAAILMFLPWIPVVLAGLSEHSRDGGAAAARLTSFEALRAVFSVLSNGILLIPPAIVGLALVYYKRFSASEKYLVLVTLITTSAMFLLNEVAPVLVENRIRYTVILVVPYCCVAAIGLRQLPSWKRLRIPLLALWCVSFIYYQGTDDYAAFTNILQHETRKIPRYQDFIYESEKLPGHNELILSFHPNMILSSAKTLPYYRKMITDWSYIVHITYDSDGELVIQSDQARYGSLDAIVANNPTVWLLHNPSQMSLDDLPVYTDWFTDHFRNCKRYRETEQSIIDYYVTYTIPCDLIDADLPLTVHYDNGFVLANAIAEQTDDDLNVYLRWTATIDKEYSLSLQVFDQTGAKVRQLDAVIYGGPIDDFAFDVSDLTVGEYNINLIVYDFESGKSVSGIVTGDERRFERSLTLASFTHNGNS